MLDEKDIAEVRDVTGKSILTPKGWVKISKVYKTVPLDAVRVKAGAYSLVCSEKHLIMTAAGEWVHAGTIVPGLLVETVDGPAAISSIEHLPEKQVLYDITIDDPSGQYWSDGFLSHNSTTFVARQLILSHLIPKYKSLYICPRADQLTTYGNRFLEMESAFRFPIKGQNKYSKVYKSSKSTIDFNYCLTSADAVRGKTVDECLFVHDQVLIKDLVSGIDVYREIRHIKPGDYVKSLAYENGNYIERYNKVVAYKSKGTRPCWRVRTAGGKSILCTANHKLGVPGGWAYVADLRANANVAVGAAAGPQHDSWESCTLYADRYYAWGRVYSNDFKQYSEILCAPRSISAGICYSESAAVAAMGITLWYTYNREQGLREFVGNLCHEIPPVDGTLQSYVLPEWEKSCNGRDSGRVGCGSYSLVADGRRLPVSGPNSIPHTIFFRERSGSVSRKTTSHGPTGGSSHGNCKQKDWKYVQPDNFECRKLTCTGSYGSTIYASYVFLQVAGTAADTTGMLVLWRDILCDETGCKTAQAQLLQETGMQSSTEEIILHTVQRLASGTESKNQKDGEGAAGGIRVCTREAQAKCYCEPQEVQRKIQRGKEKKEGRGEKATLITIDGPEEIVSIEYCGMLPVADIQVARDECYVANGILSHNCLIDEAQGMDPDILPEILKTQTITKIPSTIYAGTALSVDTLLEDKWQSSSKGVWHVRAGNGKDWLNMYDADTLKAVCRSREGPKCPITGKILNMRDGCYVHSDRRALLEGNIGLHVPQCIIPDLVTDPLQWGKIYLAVRDQDEKKVLQETFGIAVAESSREITEGDLRRICVLEDTEVETLEKCRNGYYRLILSGCDWGGSDHNQAIGTKTSYTVHCIIGVAPDDVVDILYYKRYFGMEYPKIIEDIAYNHKKYNGTAAGTDFGAGMYYNTTLRNLIPMESHFVLDYTTPRSAPLASPKGQHMTNQLSVNRTEAISSLYSALKSPHMKIRAKKWDEMSSYLLEWLNMYRAPIELPGGQTGFKYIRSASKADDSLHAFNFAYILARFFLGEPMVNDVKLQNQLRDVLNGFVQPRENTSEVADILFGPETLALHG